MAGEGFFLDPEQTNDDFLFLAPKREGSTVVPIIDGVETFRAMEKAIANAQTSVHLAAWIFNPGPRMPLAAKKEVNKILRDRSVKSGISTWSELLATVSGLGADVRILITDFDPILQNLYHEIAWTAYRILRTDAAQQVNAHLEVMCSLHDAKNSIGVQTKLQDHLKDVLNRLNKDVKSGKKRLFDMPRLWPFVTFDSSHGKFIQASSPPWLLRPASHHQKICIVDASIGFCGGLDVQIGRFDTKIHDKLWHDTHCKIDMQLAADLDRNFIGRWNREAPIFNNFISNVSSGTHTFKAVTNIPSPSGSTSTGSGPAIGQLVRTLSENAVIWPVPNNLREDIKNVYQKAIGQASEFIYIENQYIRDARLADWILARANDIQQLVVILVLPVAPEEVTLPGGADPVTLKGLFLQHQILTRLKNELGARFGLYSMVAPVTAQNQKNKSIWVGSPEIYVHSKTMIVDDVWATIGSANTNQRSFEVDTEANIHWYDPKSVLQFRLDLWNEMLGSPSDITTWKPTDFIDHWNYVALGNFTAKPKKRQGFITIHDPDNPNVKGQDDSNIPGAFAELVDNEPENECLI